MVEIKFRCPQCTQKLAVSGGDAGRELECPVCGASVRIPPGADLPPQLLATGNKIQPGSLVRVPAPGRIAPLPPAAPPLQPAQAPTSSGLTTRPMAPDTTPVVPPRPATVPPRPMAPAAPPPVRPAGTPASILPSAPISPGVPTQLANIAPRPVSTPAQRPASPAADPAELARLESELEKARAGLKEAQAGLRTMESARDGLAEQLAEQVTEHVAVVSQRDALAEQLAEQVSERAAVVTERNALEEEVARLWEMLAVRAKERDAAQAQAEESWRSKVASALEEAGKWKADARAATENLGVVIKERDGLKTQLAVMTTLCEGLQASECRGDAEYQLLREQLEESRGMVETLRRQLREVGAHFAESERERVELLRKLQDSPTWQKVTG